MVLDYLSEIGFACHATKLRANDYGLPQRRCRYYIFGLRIVSNLSEHARLLVEKIPLRLQAMSSTVCEPVARDLARETWFCYVLITVLR